MSVSEEVLRRYAKLKPFKGNIAPGVGYVRDMAIELLALRDANRWIQGVPQNSAPVLVQVYCGDSDWQDVAWFNGITWFSQAGGMFHKGMNVAGWRALPAPPEKV